jgi:hypothetical protein
MAVIDDLQQVTALVGIQRSAEAAKEIKELISTSVGQVKEGVGLVAQTGDMHMKNLALLKTADAGAKAFTTVRFAPLYDAV